MNPTFGLNGTHCAKCGKPLLKSESIWCFDCEVKARIETMNGVVRNATENRFREIESRLSYLEGDPHTPPATADDFDVLEG